MYRLGLKRALDICFASLGLIVSSPLLCLMALAIKIQDWGPVLYRGLRVGRGKKPFYILKFRTMVVDADCVGPSSTADDDTRITPVGAFLRRWKLDELPQLFNVFRGEMSLVGPRPEVPSMVDRYRDDEWRLLTVRPGITDISSIRFRNEGEILRGSEDPDRDYLEKIAPEKIRLGLDYVTRCSFGLDLKILLATFCAVAAGRPDWVFPELGAEQT